MQNRYTSVKMAYNKNVLFHLKTRLLLITHQFYRHLSTITKLLIIKRGSAQCLHAFSCSASALLCLFCTSDCLSAEMWFGFDYKLFVQRELKTHKDLTGGSGMGKTADSDKNDAADKVESKEKHGKKEQEEDVGEKEQKGKGRSKDEKKDKDGKDQKDNGGKEEKKEKKKKSDKEDGGKKKEKKNFEDEKDPAKLKQKLEKIDAKMQALAAKKEGILKLLNQVEKGAANPTSTA